MKNDNQQPEQNNNQSAEELVAKGIALGQQNKLDAAIEIFNQAIALDPEFDKAYYNRGIEHD